MTYDIIIWVLVVMVVSNLFYRKGIKAGIKHSLLKLRLTQYQVHSLNEELQKDGYDLSVETLKEVPKKALTLYN